MTRQNEHKASCEDACHSITHMPYSLSECSAAAQVLQFVLEAVRAEAFNPATLFLFGSYTIGKERLFLEVARILKRRVCFAAVGQERPTTWVATAHLFMGTHSRVACWSVSLRLQR